MARRPRIQIHGGFYHVMSRGNRKEPIFIDDRHRRRFLKIVAAAIQRYGAVCLGYCLMGNHYHLVICTPRGNISLLMRHVNGLYTSYANWRNHWTGHVLEGRFTSIIVDSDSYLLNALAYVARNPVTAGLVTKPEHWEWSHYRATMGLCGRPPFLDLDWLPQVCAASTLQESRRLFRDAVLASADDNVDWESGVVTGAEPLKKSVRSVVGATLYQAAVPRSYRELGQPPLRDLFDGVRKSQRRTAILRAHVVHGYLLADIARYLDLHPTTISRIVNLTGTYRDKVAD